MKKDEDIDLGIDNLIEKSKNKNNFSNKKMKKPFNNSNYEDKKSVIKQKENKNIGKYHKYVDDEENGYSIS